jgi:Polyketide cyclase / dehydrase and lipid transport
MSRVVARAGGHVEAAPERVLQFLSDYLQSRPRILPESYSGYRVEQGGTGQGTVFSYHFSAGGRERDYRMDVSARAGGLEERDQLSSFVTTWTVAARQAGSEVTLESSWDGAGGVAGFFEARFAPLGLRRIYAQVLARLAAELAG